MKCFCDRRFGRRIDQQLRHLTREVVTRGSMHAPLLAQRFGAGENFFRHHVNGAPVLGQCNTERLRATLLKFFEILCRQVKTIRMIDAEACHCAITHQLQKKPVNGIENLWEFDTNRRQLVYVEKTAVIDFFGRDAPKGQPIRLRIKQFIEGIEAAWVARLSVDMRQRFIDGLLHLRGFGAKPLQPPFDDFFFANALRDSFLIGFRALRQILERSQYAL